MSQWRSSSTWRWNNSAKLTATRTANTNWKRVDTVMRCTKQTHTILDEAQKAQRIYQTPWQNNMYPHTDCKGKKSREVGIDNQPRSVTATSSKPSCTESSLYVLQSSPFPVHPTDSQHKNVRKTLSVESVLEQSNCEDSPFTPQVSSFSVTAYA